MLISEIDKALKDHYRLHKEANGGTKTANEKYGLRTIQYKLAEADGTTYGPFKGRGSVNRAYKDEIKSKGKQLDGVKFFVETVYKPKAKDAPAVVEKVEEFLLTTKK